jgi:hypothetical protein
MPLALERPLYKTKPKGKAKISLQSINCTQNVHLSFICSVLHHNSADSQRKVLTKTDNTVPLNRKFARMRLFLLTKHSPVQSTESIQLASKAGTSYN